MAGHMRNLRGPDVARTWPAGRKLCTTEVGTQSHTAAAENLYTPCRPSHHAATSSVESSCIVERADRHAASRLQTLTTRTVCYDIIDNKNCVLIKGLPPAFRLCYCRNFVLDRMTLIRELNGSVRKLCLLTNEISAIAEIAHVVLVNPDTGIVENPILDANTVDFHVTSTVCCPSLNPTAGRYGTLP